MPIYEYHASDSSKGCAYCTDRFEVMQQVFDKPLSHCPTCGTRVRKLISWCRAVVAKNNDVTGKIEKRVEAYERKGMWSHAAEVADKHSEKVRNTCMKLRAIDNYAKAGYDSGALEKHAKINFCDND